MQAQEQDWEYKCQEKEVPSLIFHPLLELSVLRLLLMRALKIVTTLLSVYCLETLKKCTLELVQRSENFSSCSLPSMSLATELGSLRKLWLAMVLADIDALDGGMSLEDGSTSEGGIFSWYIMETITITV